MLIKRTKSKLRVAFLEPSPRICGAVLWAFAMRDGMLKNGIHADMVCATKSGKVRKAWGIRPDNGVGWWPTQPDVTCKISELSATLSKYDVIVLSDIRCLPVDGEAAKADTLPWYIEHVINSGVPFTAMIHGNRYDGKAMPFGEELLKAKNFSGWLVAASKYGISTSEQLQAANCKMIPLPYVPMVAIDAPARPATRVAGFTGRVIPNKGALSAVGAAYFLSSKWKMIMQGACSIGRGPCYSHQFAESLEKKGYAIQFDNNRAYVLKPMCWTAERDDRAFAEYLGAYDSAVEACSKLTVHINASGSKYSQGQVEYTTMEAMDAGCICITPRHVSSSEYTLVLLDEGHEHQNPSDWNNDPHSSKHIAKKVVQAYVAYEELGSEIVKHNRKLLRAINGADVVARQLLTLLEYIR